MRKPLNLHTTDVALTLYNHTVQKQEHTHKMEHVSGLAGKFQLGKAVSSRAAELYRLAEVKGVLGVREVTSAALALACLEISAGQLGETFDKTQAQKMSGLPQRAYASVVQSVGKILNLTTSVSLRELAVRFGALEAEQLAIDTLRNYRDKTESLYSETQKEWLDLTEPLYAAAALYTACRAMKFRSDRSEFQSVANCPSRAVFQSVLEQMKDCIPKIEVAAGGKKSRKRKGGDKAADATAEKEQPETREEERSSQQDGRGPRRLARPRFVRESLWSRMVSCPESKDYLQWKEAILTAARAKIPQ
jgi:origin recognition complex subunit 6